MRINELLCEQEQLDELSLKGLGTGLGKAIGAVPGAIVQGAKNVWSGVKQGYQGAQQALSPDGEPAATGTTTPATTTTPAPAPAPADQTGGAGEVGATDILARAKQGTTQDPAAQQATTPAPAPAPTPAPTPAAPDPVQGAVADQQAKVGVGQINKIIPTLRTRDLQSVKKNVDATIAKKTKQPAAAPAPAAPAAAPAPAAPEDDNPNIVKGYNESRKVVGFRSRFLAMDI